MKAQRSINAQESNLRSTAPMSRRSIALTSGALVAICVIALSVRFYRLTDRSLWLDEILTSQPAHLNGPGDVIAWSWAALNQMPLFYIFTWLLHPWGDAEFVLRLPAVVAGALTVPAVFMVGRAAFGTRAGLVAALLTAVMPFAVWYSQEARSYTLLMLLTTMQMWFALRSIKPKREQARVLDWLGLAVFTILNLYTHYLAILATAAVATYIAGAQLAGPFRRLALRAKAATAILLVVVVTTAALLPWRSAMRVAYDYAHLHRGVAVALPAVSLVAIGFLGFLVWRKWRAAGYALAAAWVVAVAYAPWLPALFVFLSRPDQSLGQIQLGHSPGIADLAITLGALGLSGPLLAMLVLGLGSAALQTFQGRAIESGLMLAWIVIPLVVLTAYARSAIVAIDIRYLAPLFPAAMILIGGGVVGVASLAEQAAKRLNRGSVQPWMGATVGALLTAVLLGQSLLGLSASYHQWKDDYRATAQHIAASSPPGSVVLTVGTYSDWTVICLDYYFRQLGADITVVDGLQVTSQLAGKLNRSRGATVWAVVIFPSPAQRDLFSSSDTVRSDFVDVTGNVRVLRPVQSGLTPIDQAATLLRWELPLEPELGQSLTRLAT